MDQIANPSPAFQRHPGKVITVEPYIGTVTVRAGDAVIASSKKAKVLTESPYPRVLYIPFEDIDFDQLRKTELSTHCPYKGDASYWSVLPAAEAGKDGCGRMSSLSTRWSKSAITAHSIPTRLRSKPNQPEQGRLETCLVDQSVMRPLRGGRRCREARRSLLSFSSRRPFARAFTSGMDRLVNMSR